VASSTQVRGTRVVARRRPRRWGRRLGTALCTVVVLTLAGLGAEWVLTPSVEGADTLVARFLTAHHGEALQGVVPPKVASALIATEDSRFYSNPGVDPLSVLRAPVALVLQRDQGGATLEQQLAKNLYEQGRTGGLATVGAAVLALKLDRSWSKAQILRMYVDDGYYGHGYYGLTMAARGYFRLRPADLTWAQSSLLMGLLQAPSAYDPVRHPDAARARQAHVLDRLVSTGALSRADATAVAAESWGLRAAG
jgi:membrane peptidoglycan carboxypeptidase